MELRKTIGKNLRLLREDNGLSQLDIAKELNITQAAVARYESGASCPNENILLWYANRFNASLDFLFGRTYYKRGGILKEEFKRSLSKDFQDVFSEQMEPGTATYKKIKELVEDFCKDYNSEKWGKQWQVLFMLDTVVKDKLKIRY